jgi:hypothetical protein
MQGKCVRSILFLCYSLFLFSCKNEAVAPEKLQGYWVLESATREGNTTTTLDGTWLEFEQTGQKVRTNLPVGFSGTEQYAITAKQITVNANPPLAFDVLTATDTTLSLAFQTRGFAFTMQLRKTEKPTETPIEVQPVAQ